jgi:restriction system protein
MPKKSRQAECVRWFEPLLTALRDLGGSASPREALDRIAELEQVPDELRNTLLKSGQERFYNQVHWARQYLVWEGLIESGRRGVWSLTPAGRDRTLTAEQAREFFLRQVQGQARIRKSAEAGGGQAEVDAGIPSDTPQADQDSSLQRFLDVVKGMSPNGFERLCMRLLREAGFDRIQVKVRGLVARVE